MSETYVRATCGCQFRVAGFVPDSVRCTVHNRAVGLWALSDCPIPVTSRCESVLPRMAEPHAKRFAVGEAEECGIGSYVRFEDYEALRRQYDATAEGYRAALSTAERDVKRLDWLETKVVNVRESLRYGSLDLFWASPTDADADTDYAPSDLRKQIDRARVPSGGET